MKNRINFLVNRENSLLAINLSKYKNDRYTLFIYLKIQNKNFSRSHKQTFGQKKFNLLYSSLKDIIEKRNIDQIDDDLLRNKDITIWHDLNKWSEPVLSVTDITEDGKDLVLFIMYVEDLKALYDYFSFIQNDLSDEKYKERIEDQYFDIDGSLVELIISDNNEKDITFTKVAAMVDGGEPC